MQKLSVWHEHWREIMDIEQDFCKRDYGRLMDTYGTKEFIRFINRTCMARRIPKSWISQIHYDLSWDIWTRLCALYNEEE